jgi:hypothetical protein
MHASDSSAPCPGFLPTSPLLGSSRCLTFISLRATAEFNDGGAGGRRGRPTSPDFSPTVLSFSSLNRPDKSRNPGSRNGEGPGHEHLHPRETSMVPLVDAAETAATRRGSLPIRGRPGFAAEAGRGDALVPASAATPGIPSRPPGRGRTRTRPLSGWESLLAARAWALLKRIPARGEPCAKGGDIVYRVQWPGSPNSQTSSCGLDASSRRQGPRKSKSRRRAPHVSNAFFCQTSMSLLDSACLGWSKKTKNKSRLRGKPTTVM